MGMGGSDVIYLIDGSVKTVYARNRGPLTEILQSMRKKCKEKNRSVNGEVNDVPKKQRRK